MVLIRGTQSLSAHSCWEIILSSFLLTSDLLWLVLMLITPGGVSSPFSWYIWNSSLLWYRHRISSLCGYLPSLPKQTFLPLHQTSVWRLSR